MENIIEVVKEAYIMMQEELHAAKRYAHKSAEYEKSYPEFAKAYNKMAYDKLDHANLIYNTLMKKVEDMKRSGTVLPAEVIIILDYEQKKYEEKMAKIKMMLQTNRM